MNFVDTVKKSLEPLLLLNHPFYQAWTKGELSKETLQTYAIQYHKHVCAFPRYVSRVHSRCEDIKGRQLLLENLNDEEGFPKGTNHPELWRRFAQGLGCTDSEINKAKTRPSINKLMEGFFKSADASYEEGLGALYAYESQVPEVAATKIQGLKEHYGITDKRALEFFEVHLEADIYHRQACEKLLNKVPVRKQEQVQAALIEVAQNLWNFLSDMMALEKAAAPAH